MYVTTDQAVEMYARFLKAHYGAEAKRVTEEKIRQLRDMGDTEGERIWAEVARKVAAPHLG
jgi:hypothetical protein